MCGRFTLTFDEYYLSGFLKDRFDIVDPLRKITLPRYNIAPGQDVLALINDGTRYRAGTLKWGYLPHYQKDPNKGIINARAETLATSKAFVDSYRMRRCVLVADGFYEWKTESGKKKPYHFTARDKDVFMLAGIWNQTRTSSGEKLYTCAIVTTAANQLVKTIHDRMPLILDDKDTRRWLDPGLDDPSILRNLTKPYPPEKMLYREVGDLVNNAGNEGPELLKNIN